MILLPMHEVYHARKRQHIPGWGKSSQNVGNDKPPSGPCIHLQKAAQSLATDHCSYGRSGLFGPPLCGGSAPATPPLNHAVPHRPGVDIRNRYLFERVQPDHVPPVPSEPRRCRPCACPRTRPNCRTPLSGRAWRLRCVSPKDGKQRQPPLAPIHRQTVPTPNLGYTPLLIMQIRRYGNRTSVHFWFKFCTPIRQTFLPPNACKTPLNVHTPPSTRPDCRQGRNRSRR